MECKKHPRYEGKNPPRKTKKHPKGCPGCWWIYANRKAKEKGYNINYEETIGIGNLGSAYNWL